MIRQATAASRSRREPMAGARDGKSSWTSAAVSLLLVGGAAVLMNRHDTVYRDRYLTREDCERDWQQHARDCSSAGAGTRFYYGPSYERGQRPRTAAPGLRTGSDLVQRAGFGRSGARFSAGT